jgi:cytochrome P450
VTGLPQDQRRGRPPGPKGGLLLGSLPDFARDILGFFERCAREHGDAVYLRLGFGFEACAFFHPELIESVLVTNHQSFRKHRFFFRHVEALFGSGLLTSEGAPWIRQRRLAQPAFHRARIQAYGEAMLRHAERMMEGWRVGEPRDVHRDMMGVTMRIVGETLFGADLAGQTAEIGEAFDDVVREIAVRFRRPFRIPDRVPTPGNLRYRRGVGRLDALVGGIIALRRADPAERGDLLSLLLAARDEDGGRMSDRQLRDEVVTLFLAGHETTALALSWTWYLLGRSPRARAALGDELRGVLGGRPPGVGDLPRLRYAEAVIQESMRLYPPAYVIGREAAEACEVGGYTLAPGTTVYLAPWVTQRDPRFFDDPLRFEPERWLTGRAKELPRYAYFPFGGGPRLCIGNTFAMMEAVLLLAAIAQRFRLELAPGHEVTPFASITLRPSQGVWVVPEAV